MNLGMWKESQEEARGRRGSEGMVVAPVGSLVVVWSWLSLVVKSRALMEVVWWSVIGNVVFVTNDVDCASGGL